MARASWAGGVSSRAGPWVDCWAEVKEGEEVSQLGRGMGWGRELAGLEEKKRMDRIREIRPKGKKGGFSIFD